MKLVGYAGVVGCVGGVVLVWRVWWCDGVVVVWCVVGAGVGFGGGWLCWCLCGGVVEVVWGTVVAWWLVVVGWWWCWCRGGWWNDDADVLGWWWCGEVVLVWGTVVRLCWCGAVILVL